ncbi:LacI family DNA-binding transcriptional regulator [Butyrivibrio sp. YAB3001]|uniref:LacI family DNA-binding transcriptional regulator n=1 Tax=Butyrivibrio sp. YAB3001 TaxID=1520812 RepID=UPI0008F68187|nr:LacI family DNA-binding transcriptional regulator [Butyrivibrio sp. YAB3001]SFC44292.1 LacI family transcriptional regulator [Butyrivibrio sp. YAB3001]
MERDKSSVGKTITIYDIAEEAGVSASTVSRVLNGSASVRKEKKEKIQSIIDKYDFKPNALAKGLSDTATKMIGILVADVRNPYYSEMFASCEKAAEEAGYSVALVNFHGSKERELAQLDNLIRQRPDAVIQMGGRVDDLITDDAYAEKIRRVSQNIPFIITGKLDKTSVHSVVIDESHGMDLVMDHLISLGHTKIALVGGEMRVVSTYKKYQSYQESLQKHGIVERGEYVVNSFYDPESGYEATNKVLELKDRPTAIITINDFAASGALRSIIEHGLRIPEDISIASFDNTYIAELTVPKLTSIDYNYSDYGKKLVDTAISIIQGNDAEYIQMVEPRLIIRESTGPVPE